MILRALNTQIGSPHHSERLSRASGLGKLTTKYPCNPAITKSGLSRFFKIFLNILQKRKVGCSVEAIELRQLRQLSDNSSALLWLVTQLCNIHRSSKAFYSNSFKIKYSLKHNSFGFSLYFKAEVSLRFKCLVLIFSFCIKLYMNKIWPYIVGKYEQGLGILPFPCTCSSGACQQREDFRFMCNLDILHLC